MTTLGEVSRQRKQPCKLPEARVGAMLVGEAFKKAVATGVEGSEVREFKGSQRLRSLAGCYRGFSFRLDEMNPL